MEFAKIARTEYRHSHHRLLESLTLQSTNADYDFYRSESGNECAVYIYGVAKPCRLPNKR